MARALVACGPVIRDLEAGEKLLPGVARQTGEQIDIEGAAGAVALELHRPATDRRERRQLDVAAGKRLNLRPRRIVADVLCYLRERWQGEETAGAGGLEHARVSHAARVARERRNRQLAPTARLEARAIGVRKSAEARCAAAYAERPAGECRELAGGKRAGPVQAQVRLLERGQGARASGPVIRDLKAGEKLLPGVARQTGERIDIERAAGAVALELHGPATDRA